MLFNDTEKPCGKSVMDILLIDYNQIEWYLNKSCFDCSNYCFFFFCISGLDIRVDADDCPEGKSSRNIPLVVTCRTWHRPGVGTSVPENEEMRGDRFDVVVDNDLLSGVVVEGITRVSDFVILKAVDLFLKPLGLACVCWSVDPEISFLSC